MERIQRKVSNFEKVASFERKSENQMVTVRRGDTLAKIANRNGVSLDDLKKMNPSLERDRNFNLLKIGDKVNIGTGTQKKMVSHFAKILENKEKIHNLKPLNRSLYVKRGETLDTIAQKYGMSLKDLKSLNPSLERGQNFNLLKIGDKVNLVRTPVAANTNIEKVASHKRHKSTWQINGLSLIERPVRRHTTMSERKMMQKVASFLKDHTHQSLDSKSYTLNFVEKYQSVSGHKRADYKRTMGYKLKLSSYGRRFLKLGNNPVRRGQIRKIERDYGQIISTVGDKNGIDKNLITGIIVQEFGPFLSKDPRKVKAYHRADRGLMQINTNAHTHVDAESLYDPKTNIEYGVKYLAKLVAKYKRKQGHTRIPVGNPVERALQAYNWGPGNVDRVLSGKKRLKSSVKRYSQRILAYQQIAQVI